MLCRQVRTTRRAIRLHKPFDDLGMRCPLAAIYLHMKQHSSLLPKPTKVGHRERHGSHYFFHRVSVLIVHRYHSYAAYISSDTV